MTLLSLLDDCIKKDIDNLDMILGKCYSNFILLYYKIKELDINIDEVRISNEMKNGLNKTSFKISINNDVDISNIVTSKEFSIKKDNKIIDITAISNEEMVI